MTAARCSQCGQPFTARACGPTHALIATEDDRRRSPEDRGRESLRPQDYAATPSTVPEGFDLELVPAPPPPLVLERNGRLVVEWPHGRPRWFVLTPEALDELVSQVNDLRDDLALLETAEECPHDAESGADGPVVDLPGGIVVRWRCDGCGRIRTDVDALAELRAGYRPDTEQGDEPDDPPCTSPEGHAWSVAGRCDRCGATSPTVPW